MIRRTLDTKGMHYGGLGYMRIGSFFRGSRTAILALVLALNLPQSALADNAAVLPTGVSRGYWDFYRYLSTTQRYNADGEQEDLAHPFTNAPLDSSVFPVLALLGPNATLGDVAIDYQYDIDVLDLGYSYGLSDRLSIGLHIPYYWITNNVDAALDTTNATVGLNPGAGPPLIPIASGGIPMTTDDVQNLVRDQFGFSRIDTWQGEGIGDIELGGKYQFFLAERSAFAITGGLRIPSGYEDDADKLDDVAWSFGNYALLLRLHYDYLISNRKHQPTSSLHQLVPAAGDTVLNLTFRYDYMLPDDKVMRIGATTEQILTTNRERVERKLGDIVNLEVSTKYHFSNAFAAMAVYTYGFKQKDDIDGDMGFNYASLEADTDAREHIFILELSYSTLAAYRDKKSAAPMEFSIAYRDRFKAEGPFSGQANPKLDTRWFVAGMTILF